MGCCMSSLRELDCSRGNARVYDGSRSKYAHLHRQSSLSASRYVTFAYSDLRIATKDFSVHRMLGKCRITCVYKGLIDEQLQRRVDLPPIVAVKRRHRVFFELNFVWLCNIYVTGRFGHPHLVRLLGGGSSGEHSYSVYEYMPLGSVEDHLFPHHHSDKGCPTGEHPFSWNLRLKVAVQAARGLAFLHEAEFVHRNLKSSNILLDQDFIAKLSDFEMSYDRYYLRSELNMLRCKGDKGYRERFCCPQGPKTLDRESDVYSFGVVLLEMFSGRRALEPIEGTVWIKYANIRVENVMAMASNMGCKYDLDGSYKLARLIHNCLNHQRDARPTMSRVLDKLEYVYKHHQVKEFAYYDQDRAERAFSRVDLGGYSSS